MERWQEREGEQGDGLGTEGVWGESSGENGGYPGKGGGVGRCLRQEMDGRLRDIPPASRLAFA